MDNIVLILAGGLGKRMNSDLPKVLHLLKDKPLIVHVIETALKINPSKIGIIVGKYRDVIEKNINKYIKDTSRIEYIIQLEALGTGHAIMCCKDFLSNYKKSFVTILSGDVPLIKNNTLKKLNDAIIKKEAVILVNKLENPYGYGRVITDGEQFVKIVEEKDCDEIERKVDLVNSGIYCLTCDAILNNIHKINNNNKQKEYYLTDIFNFIDQDKTDLIYLENMYEVMGVNTPEQLKELEMQNIGIVGVGFVGNAIKCFFESRINIVCYDKYKELNKIEEILSTDLAFLCLPTLFDEEKNEYDKSGIYEICDFLCKNNFLGLIVLKSTVEPETTDKLSNMFKNLKICHNPEFLTARSAVQDFNNQNHIIIGKGSNCNDKDVNILENLYRKYYPNVEISLCTSLESESMKIMCNSFYASKVMIFNEYYLLCKKNGSDYKKIVELMLKNNWINPMHTDVPGPDGLMAYGGACFPKDTQALNKYMETYKTDNLVLSNVINECKLLRKE